MSNPASSDNEDFTGFAGGIRVLEIGDELGEYCGKVLAGLGADVVRVEPPGGETTRSYGPFYHDVPDPARSLYFWHYNLGKRSVELDLDTPEGREQFAQLAAAADVVIDTRPRGYLDERGLGYDRLTAANPRLIWARITPFGETGPWADYGASDLVHLALGGIMLNCGYDPDPAGHYDTPPIAPQMWQAYHLGGEMTVIAILGALNYRLSSGRGQRLSTSVHDAVSKNTETDLPDWVYLAQPHMRLTCRHSSTRITGTALAMSKDGRWLLPYRAGGGGVGVGAWTGTVALLKDYGMQDDLEDPKYDGDYRNTAEAADHVAVLTDRLVGRLMFDRDLWRDAQAYGLPWAALRRPEENISEEHWQMRGSFFEVYHDELDETFVYTGGKWLTEGMPWSGKRRPPLAGEHTAEVLASWVGPAVPRPRMHVSPRASQPPVVSRHGKPFALSDIRIVDLSWMLASAGAGRYFAAMGAEVIKVEHVSHLDGMRYAPIGAYPAGGREERDRATGPIPPPPANGSVDRCGSFMEINSGKLGLSLDLRQPRGREILEDLIRDADMVIEGFSPGTMTRMGLGYDKLRELNPSIIYVQQSGLGEAGLYGRARTYGPTAAAITGLSEMSGLPEPFPPAGIGYSYLDWFGAYNMANAMLAALYRRNVTGLGCHIDASQGETGLYLTGTSILDWTVNGRRWSRYGNRSPYKPAAPNGAYRTAGEDRWIAISAFTDSQWAAVASVLGLSADSRFDSLAGRLSHQDDLDALVGAATAGRDGYELMAELQRRGVPAGVCQTAQDRYENDPQLAHLGWLPEVRQADFGVWPVKEVPVKLSETPTYIGGRLDRSGPSYGQDNQYVLGEILKLSSEEIEELRSAGVL